jgi:hypothetical protein
MRRRRKVKGDLKAAAEMFGGVSASDYGTQSFHIPYGPGFDSKKVEKFIYGTDLGGSISNDKFLILTYSKGMNSTFNPKNKDRRLHRHPAFFGTMVEVMNDCCEVCPYLLLLSNLLTPDSIAQSRSPQRRKSCRQLRMRNTFVVVSSECLFTPLPHVLTSVGLCRRIPGGK